MASLPSPILSPALLHLSPPDPFTAHFETELSQEEVASLDTVVSPLAPPPSLPPLGLVSWRPALAGREPVISYKPRSLRELQVCASVM